MKPASKRIAKLLHRVCAADRIAAAEKAKRLRAYPELIKALRDATNALWSALGGAEDSTNKSHANRLCARYEALLRRLGEEL